MRTNIDHFRPVLVTNTPAETEHLGELLGARLKGGDVVCLSGTLGAGKTCLVRGLARGWGAVEHPTSPTFTLINEYRQTQGSQRFYHVDCYRLSGMVDAWTTGLEELFNPVDVIVIEWPERILDLLPPDRLWIDICDLGNTSRRFTLAASGHRAQLLAAAMAPPPKA
ncbi:MAG: tRNA (adenosine(37)-N6)-threonylcarbamoyltransferase complex ATPase subunit type 1 TsaE [Anaerolineae bacterium]|nr:tRNA (adenosine(37)-N6)-threonylcarbamoyltransferase complex ATPase subunit type 1 TsaE [Anaerolineae bacterium]